MKPLNLSLTYHIQKSLLDLLRAANTSDKYRVVYQPSLFNNNIAEITVQSKSTKR